MWQHYISEQGNLKPDELLQTFKKLVEKAVKQRKRNALCNIGPEITVELRKIPVMFKITWNGNKYRNFAIAIDLTVCISTSGWPEASDIRHRLKRSILAMNCPGSDSWKTPSCRLLDWRGWTVTALLAFAVLCCRGYCTQINMQDDSQTDQGLAKEKRR